MSDKSNSTSYSLQLHLQCRSDRGRTFDVSTKRAVFVGKLDLTVTDESFSDLLSEAGVVVNAKVHLRPDGTSRGWGWVHCVHQMRVWRDSHEWQHSLIIFFYNSDICQRISIQNQLSSYFLFLFILLTELLNSKLRKKQKLQSLCLMVGCRLMVRTWKYVMTECVNRVRLKCDGRCGNKKEFQTIRQRQNYKYS